MSCGRIHDVHHRCIAPRLPMGLLTPPSNPTVGKRRLQQKELTPRSSHTGASFRQKDSSGFGLGLGFFNKKEKELILGISLRFALVYTPIQLSNLESKIQTELCSATTTDTERLASSALGMGDALTRASPTSSPRLPELRVRAAAEARGRSRSPACGPWIPSKTTAGDVPPPTAPPPGTKLAGSWQTHPRRGPLHQTSPKQPRGIAKTFFLLR